MSTRPYGDSKPVKKAYIVLVSGTLAVDKLEWFADRLKPMAQYVAENEPGCLAYELSISTTNPGSFVLYERWESKEYLEQIHFQSEPFKKLGVEMAEQGIDLSKFLSTYYEQDIGF